MQLKIYQQNTLDVLRRFLEQCRLHGVQEAYRSITDEAEISDRLRGEKSLSYNAWQGQEQTPRVCLKVPTGGGKTILAAHSLRLVSETWCEKEYPLVLWFCPSDTIRKQTTESLKNPRHPYRQVLDEQFNSKVRIYDIDEKFNILPHDIAQNACIIVSTIQAFRQSNTDKYRVYAHNENLEPHFASIPAQEGMELLGNGQTKFSFANLLFYHRPIEIVDEAHNAVSHLTQEVHRRLNPSAIIELTATPQANNNTLYLVHPLELKEEEMIKLPIELVENIGWESAVDQAIAKRAELEEAAKKDRDYLRPVLLLQAQNKNGEVTVDVLKEYLIKTVGLPKNQVAVVTGDQKELDGINITDKDCPIRFVITVEALKEGWDCSFAYVLCSLANINSDTSVMQLLGRVMRMPYAKTRRQSRLNKAYAFVLSKEFGHSAQTLVERLKEKGFSQAEAAAVVVSILPVQIFENRTGTVELEMPIDSTAVPPSIIYSEEDKTLTFTPQTTDEEVEQIAAHVLQERDRYYFKQKYAAYKTTQAESSPAKSGGPFRIPRLLVQLQGEFIFADADDIFEYFEWNLADYAPPILTEQEFAFTPQGRVYSIDLDGKKLFYEPVQTTELFSAIEGWTSDRLAYWLDGKLGTFDLPQSVLIDWLSQTIEYLMQERCIGLPELVSAKYVLMSKLRDKINAARISARGESYQQAFFVPESRIMLDFDNGFEFKDGMYDGVPLYQGDYRFTKHFLGSKKVPEFDGNEDGEEVLCAKVIDQCDKVEFWLRNVAKHPNSFWLPTATDKFYPDFVAKLKTGELLIVEYKGAHLLQDKDTKQKLRIGKIYAGQSGGAIRFAMPSISKGTKNNARWDGIERMIFASTE